MLYELSRDFRETCLSILFDAPVHTLQTLIFADIYIDICNFTGDANPHSSSTNVNKAVTNIEHDCTLLIDWPRYNYMTLNASKSYMLVSGYKDELMFAKVGVEPLWEEDSAKLLGIQLEYPIPSLPEKITYIVQSQPNTS